MQGGRWSITWSRSLNHSRPLIVLLHKNHMHETLAVQNTHSTLVLSVFFSGPLSPIVITSHRYERRALLKVLPLGSLELRFWSARVQPTTSSSATLRSFKILRAFQYLVQISNNWFSALYAKAFWKHVCNVIQLNGGQVTKWVQIVYSHLFYFML